MMFIVYFQVADDFKEARNTNEKKIQQADSDYDTRQLSDDSNSYGSGLSSSSDDSGSYGSGCFRQVRKTNRNKIRQPESLKKLLLNHLEARKTTRNKVRQSESLKMMLIQQLQARKTNRNNIRQFDSDSYGSGGDSSSYGSSSDEDSGCFTQRSKTNRNQIRQVDSDSYSFGGSFDFGDRGCGGSYDFGDYGCGQGSASAEYDSYKRNRMASRDKSELLDPLKKLLELLRKRFE